MKVYQFKICTGFYGPAPMTYKPIYVLSPNYDDALAIIFKNQKDIYSIELVSENDILIK